MKSLKEIFKMNICLKQTYQYKNLLQYLKYNGTKLISSTNNRYFFAE